MHSTVLPLNKRLRTFLLSSCNLCIVGSLDRTLKSYFDSRFYYEASVTHLLLVGLKFM